MAKVMPKKLDQMALLKSSNEDLYFQSYNDAIIQLNYDTQLH